jgi:hypothetical protein
LGVLKFEVPPPLLRAARIVLTPWRLGWAIANRRGWLGAAPVGDSPHLDPAALGRWRQELAGAGVYLEYGSGGSTVEAARTADHVVSVDSDRDFLAAVRARVVETPNATAHVETIHVDIGLTEKWGRPVFDWRTADRARQWRRYTEAPWEYLGAKGLVPDFIFVDGRFRVACVLESLLRLPNGSPASIMFDDFAIRTKGYGAVKQFADFERVGRALVLRRKTSFDRDACVRALRVYQQDPE